MLRTVSSRDKDRLRDIGEARVVISRVSKEPEATELAPARSRLGKLPWAVAGVLGLGLIVVGRTILVRRGPVSQSRPRR